MNKISLLNPKAPGAFAAMLAGALEDAPGGKPILLGCSQREEACAALAAIQLEDSLLLRWVVVDEGYRRQKIGSQLVNKLCQHAIAEGVGQVDAVVCLPDEYLPAAKALLFGRKFQLVEQNTVFSLPLSSVLKGPLAARIKRASHSRAVPLSEVTNYQLREFSFRMQREEAQPLIQPSRLLADCSFVWLEENKITGCVLLAPNGDDVEVQWLYGKNSLALQEMLVASVSALSGQKGPDTCIYVAAVQPNIESLARKLAGDALTKETSVLSFRRILR